MSELAQFDQSYFNVSTSSLAGVDEVGRGPLAGPIVAAVCAMPPGIVLNGLDDSKKLNPNKRSELNLLIRGHSQIAFAFGWVSALEIDASDIHIAALVAMALALKNLQAAPDALLVDGRFLPHRQTSMPVHIAQNRCTSLIRGDGRSQVIAAASVLAKVARDAYMVEQDRHWPQYGFAQHKGYATRQHLDALSAFGPCPLHRQSFRPVKTAQLELRDRAALGRRADFDYARSG